MSDWLEDTYNRSFDQCKEISPEYCLALAELACLLDDNITLEESLREITEPFLTNMRGDDKIIHLLQSAAKATGIEIRIENPSVASLKDKGYFGLYCDDKGRRDLSSFWKAFEALKEQTDG